MPPTKTTTITVPVIKTDALVVDIIGRTGLYCHRMSAKAKRQLMLGGRRKTAAERLDLKHDPRAEFVDSMYVIEDFHQDSHVAFPAMAFKSAMGTAALVIPGMRKTDVQRLIYVPDEYVPIFGIPTLRMDITRSADINRTPDVRTRAFFRQWATRLRIEFVEPHLNRSSIIALIQNAGHVSGVGDNRQEKGKGSFGTFSAVESDEDRALFDLLLDKDAQWDAIRTPVCANVETQELLAEFDIEVKVRS